MKLLENYNELVGRRVIVNLGRGRWGFSWGVGATGTIICFNTRDREGSVGVRFDAPGIGGTYGHNLDGHITDTPYLGNWVPCECLELLEEEFKTTPTGEFAPEPDEEGILAHLFTQIAPTAIIDGHFYTLTKTPETNADALMNPYLAKVAAHIKAIQQQANNKIMAIRAQFDNVQRMPNFEITHARQGIHFWINGTYIVWSLPLLYNPKYFGLDGKGPVNSLHPDHVSQMKRTVLVRFTVDNTGHIHEVGTYKDDGKFDTPFYHYHGNERTCLGTIKLIDIKTVQDAIAMRNAFQKLLEIVNHGHMTNRTPEDLPTYGQLDREKQPLTAGEVGWSTVKRKENPTIEATKAVVGRMVKILTVDLPQYEHNIGKTFPVVDVTVGDTLDRTLYAVQLTEKDGSTKKHYMNAMRFELLPLPETTTTAPETAGEPGGTAERTIADFTIGQLAEVLPGYARLLQPIRLPPDATLVGLIGKVVHTAPHPDGTDVLLEFLDDIGGYDGNDIGTPRGKNGHCWWFHPKDLRPRPDAVRRNHLIMFGAVVPAATTATAAATGRGAAWHTT